jgi:hypothetical protein
MDGDKQKDDNCPDIFIHDRLSESTYRVSIANDGTQSNGWSSDAAISADGTDVVFASYASNLVDGDANVFCESDTDGVIVNCPDVFVYSQARINFYLPLAIKE